MAKDLKPGDRVRVYPENHDKPLLVGVVEYVRRDHESDAVRIMLDDQIGRLFPEDRWVHGHTYGHRTRIVRLRPRATRKGGAR